MADISKTRIPVAEPEAQRLRNVVRQAELMNGRIAGARVAQRDDTAALAGLLSHDSIRPKITPSPTRSTRRPWPSS